MSVSLKVVPFKICTVMTPPAYERRRPWVAPCSIKSAVVSLMVFTAVNCAMVFSGESSATVSCWKRCWVPPMLKRPSSVKAPVAEMVTTPPATPATVPVLAPCDKASPTAGVRKPSANLAVMSKVTRCWASFPFRRKPSTKDKVSWSARVKADDKVMVLFSASTVLILIPGARPDTTSKYMPWAKPVVSATMTVALLLTAPFTVAVADAPAAKAVLASKTNIDAPSLRLPVALTPPCEMAAPAASPKKVELVVNCWNSCFFVGDRDCPGRSKVIVVVWQDHQRARRAVGQDALDDTGCSSLSDCLVDGWLRGVLNVQGDGLELEWLRGTVPRDFVPEHTVVRVDQQGGDGRGHGPQGVRFFAVDHLWCCPGVQAAHGVEGLCIGGDQHRKGGGAHGSVVDQGTGGVATVHRHGGAFGQWGGQGGGQGQNNADLAHGARTQSISLRRWMPLTEVWMVLAALEPEPSPDRPTSW